MRNDRTRMTDAGAPGQRWGECLECGRTTWLWEDGVCGVICRQKAREDRRIGSICKACGKPIPRPSSGPLRYYCDRKCERAYAAKLRKAGKPVTRREKEEEARRTAVGKAMGEVLDETVSNEERAARIQSASRTLSRERDGRNVLDLQRRILADIAVHRPDDLDRPFARRLKGMIDEAAGEGTADETIRAAREHGADA